jgi:hypothetical protein
MGGKARAELLVPRQKKDREGASRKTPRRVQVVHLPQPVVIPVAEARALIQAS